MTFKGIELPGKGGGWDEVAYYPPKLKDALEASRGDQDYVLYVRPREIPKPGESLAEQVTAELRAISPEHAEGEPGPKLLALCRVLERRFEAEQAKRAAEFELTRSRSPGLNVSFQKPTPPTTREVPRFMPGDYVRTPLGGYVLKSPLGFEHWHAFRASDNFETCIAEHRIVRAYRNGRFLWEREDDPQEARGG